MRTWGNASTPPRASLLPTQHNDQTNKTMDTYNTIEEIRQLKTCKAVRAYYKSLPRELQESPLVLMEVRRKQREILWVKFYRWWFLR